jgi:hypothetical protein
MYFTVRMSVVIAVAVTVLAVMPVTEISPVMSRPEKVGAAPVFSALSNFAIAWQMLFMSSGFGLGTSLDII